MSQPEIALYHFPGACSQVSVCALEAAGLTYDLRLVNLAAGEQASAAYLAISPLGKVPLLLIDGEALAENAAILTYIAALRPEAALFPPDPSPRMRAEAIGGLSFCAGTLHPTIRGIANPQRITDGDGEPVRQRSTALAKKSFAYAEQRIARQGWWLGTWSIVDVYVNWAFTVARNAGFDPEPFPQLSTLGERMMDRPAFRRAQEVDAAARVELGLEAPKT